MRSYSLVARSGILVFSQCLAIWAYAAPTPPTSGLKADQIHVAQSRKTETYIRDGLVVGGDRAITDVAVTGIRRAANPGGFDRIVIDLQGSRDGEPAAVTRPPYYQVALNGLENRISVTVWGNPRLNFDAKKVQEAFKKSALVEQVQLFPRLEDDTWTFSLKLKPKSPVEVFELSNPLRVILDIRGSGNVKIAKNVRKKSKPAPKAKMAISEDTVSEE